LAGADGARNVDYWLGLFSLGMFTVGWGDGVGDVTKLWLEHYCCGHRLT